MKRTSIKRILLAALLVAPVLLFSAHRLSGQRVCCQGDWWLKWDHDARESYVYGYTLGFSKGHLDGCEQGTKSWAGTPEPGTENSPLQRCIHTELDFSRGSDYFVKSITEFYERHPEDRDIYINEDLEHLAKGLTIEEIHKYPFWRHHPPDKKP